MRLLDDTPLDPEITASLEAIDGTLGGEPVDPAYAEVAELALLLTAERPRPRAAFMGALDERVQRRFALVQPRDSKSRRLGRWWLWTPAAGLAAALLVAVVIVLGGGSGPARLGSSSSAAATSARAGIPRRLSSAKNAATTAQPPTLSQRRSPATLTGSSAATPATPGSPTTLPAFAPNSAASTVLHPPANGRKIIQGAQLSLTTNPNRIDDVAQEVFVVVGQVHGVVNSSTITATRGPGGYAQFQLSIPSGSLPQAMAALSTLRYARVASRTDTTQDVNGQYRGDQHRLADDRAVRASLLQQLANAVTQGQIDSLTTRIHDIDAAISSDQATLNSLNAQIDNSQVTVTVNGGVTPVPAHTGGGGFTLRRAAHDAGRVLTVAAGVALIGLAALVPFTLLGALAWWIAVAIRRRRREQALDLV